MDVLSDILQQAGLQRRLLDMSPLEAHAALRFPCERSVGFHVVTRGQVFIHADALDAPLALVAGDMALMARGCHHVVSTLPVLPKRPIPLVGALAATGPAGEEPNGMRDAAASQAAPNRVISGAYQFWNTPLHPLFGELPAWNLVRGESLPRASPMRLTVELLDAESDRPELGSSSIRYGLLDAAFAYLLREVVKRNGHAGVGWSRAIGHAGVRQAVSLMHADSARAWTLDALAHGVGMSRTALARKFRETMGDTPLNYLRTVRMQTAMRQLSDSSATLETVAARVGYHDAFSFSKVFKRTVGIAPREFRRQDAAQRELPARL